MTGKLSMGMKIAGSSRIRTPAARKTTARGTGGGEFSVSGGAAAPATEASTPVTTNSPVTSVDALLAIQEVPNEREGRKHAVKRGNDMLDVLDDIRMGLLTGSVPRARLQKLVHMVDARRDTFTDPRLAQVLDEIELRARVELAKLEGALK